MAVHFIEADKEGKSSRVTRVVAPKIGTYVLPDDFVDEELEMYVESLKTMI